MKIELFGFINNEDVMEENINEWFKEHKNAKVKFIEQSESMGDAGVSLTISIFYEE